MDTPKACESSRRDKASDLSSNVEDFEREMTLRFFMRDLELDLEGLRSRTGIVSSMFHILSGFMTCC